MDPLPGTLERVMNCKWLAGLEGLAGLEWPTLTRIKAIGQQIRRSVPTHSMPIAKQRVRSTFSGLIAASQPRSLTYEDDKVPAFIKPLKVYDMGV